MQNETNKLQHDLYLMQNERDQLSIQLQMEQCKLCVEPKRYEFTVPVEYYINKKPHYLE